jgi:hypothetical protein
VSCFAGRCGRELSDDLQLAKRRVLSHPVGKKRVATHAEADAFPPAPAEPSRDRNDVLRSIWPSAVTMMNAAFNTGQPNRMPRLKRTERDPRQDPHEG